MSVEPGRTHRLGSFVSAILRTEIAYDLHTVFTAKYFITDAS